MQWVHQAVDTLLSEYPEGKRALQRAGPIHRDIILSVIKAFLLKFQDQSFRDKLSRVQLRQGSMEDEIDRMQKDVFESFGVDGEYGLKYLGQLQQLFREDMEVMANLCQLVNAEDSLLTEAEGSHPSPSANATLPNLAELQGDGASRTADTQNNLKGDRSLLVTGNEGAQETKQDPQANTLSAQEKMAFFKQNFSGKVDR